MKNKTLGYVYKLPSESFEKVLGLYSLNHLPQRLAQSKSEITKHFKHDRQCGEISRQAKPKVYRLILEEVE